MQIQKDQAIFIKYFANHDSPICYFLCKSYIADICFCAFSKMINANIFSRANMLSLAILKTFHGFTSVATNNLGPIDLALMTCLGYLLNRQTDNYNYTYIDYRYCQLSFLIIYIKSIIFQAEIISRKLNEELIKLV